MFIYVPVIRDEADRDALMGYVQEMADALRLMKVFDRLIEVVVDDRDLKPGEKGWSWVKKAFQFVRRLVSGNWMNKRCLWRVRDTGERV